MTPEQDGFELGRPLDARELRAWQTFMRMQELLRIRIEQQLQRNSGLSSADYTVLAVLSDTADGRMRAYELADMLGWEKSRLHHQLTRMCKRGLVERCSGGGRAVNVEITTDGRATLQRALPCHTAYVRRAVINPLTDDQLDQLAELSAEILTTLTHTEPHSAVVEP
ncbi:MarR family winged helix-turn-helix transcriptional regulator [Actinokineospora sp. NPDC004072]